MNPPTAWFATRSVIASLMLFPAYVLAQQDAPPPSHAEVKIKPIGSNSVNGTLTLEQTGESVAVKGTLHGLTPGKHGLHIHEGRSCNSRGGHFSPVNAPHGAPDSGEDKHHLGDLGNVVAGEDGTANYSGVAKNVNLTGANNIDGRVLVVHQGEDDLVSQPSGKSGEQIGCGVIKMMPQ
jgi:superoxide dismutase, Cu-Zn family